MNNTVETGNSMKIVKWILAAVVVLLVAATVAGYLFLNSSKPVYHGHIQLPGLKNEVQVFFDNFGIPHIYANNEEDLYFALGYVHAQDRLFQMELLRRVGGGRLAEIFGPGMIETDKFLRTIGLNETAELSAKAYLSDNQDPFQKAALSYLEGLNTFIRQGPTPPEFMLLGIPKEEFTPADLFRTVGYIGFNFNTGVRNDPLLTAIATNLGQEYLSDLVINTVAENTTIPTFVGDTAAVNRISVTAMEVLGSLPVPEWLGSNSWVVGPDRSTSGYPLLSNDAHIGFSQPAVWYEAHLSCPGYEFYGNHLAGFPFALIGHNDYSAWGVTIFPNDDMDFYREKIDPLDSDRVWFIDHWERMEGRKEVIKVKNSENVQFEVMSTRHGPIINEINEMVDSLEQQPVSFFWTYNMFPCKALQTAYGMAHSSSIDEFRSAISMLEAPGLNITYADKDGNIAWWAVARLIERPEHVEPKLILDGWSGQDEPLGWYPFSVNPRSENPPEGFVYSANNQPDSAYGVLHPGYYFPGLRGQRIIELLSQREKWDLVGFQEMILDDKSPQFQETGRKITSVLPDDLNELEKQAADLLNSWNGTHQLKDIGPTIYYKLINRLQENVFQDELGEENYQVYTTTLVARRTIPYLISNHSSLWWDNINTPEIETSVDIIHQSFSESIRELSNELGIDPNQWHWEQVHLLEHQHAIGKQKPFDQLFNVGTFGIAGGDEVINKMDFSKTSSPYLVKSGASMRILIDLADMENSLSIIPTGQSGHVMSPYYKDQTDLYNSGKFRKQLMNKENIISVTGKVLVLSPEISN